MDKNKIKTFLEEKFISEETTPGLGISNKIKKDNAKINKNGLDSIDKGLKVYDKTLKKNNQSEVSPNKFNYDDKFEKTYHDEMEILNGQEMLQYDANPDKRFVDRAIEGIEGSSKMGNQGGIGNAQATWGASSDDFGKNLVKRIKSSAKKRGEETPAISLRGKDIQELPTKMIDNGHKPYAIEENTNKLVEHEEPVHFRTDNFTEWAKFWKEQPVGFTAYKVKIYNDSGKQVGVEFSTNKEDIADMKEVSDGYFVEAYIIKKTETNLNENNKTNKIKESMKRLKFKKEFNGLGNALNLIPESYKTDKKEFEMTDGIENYRIRWEGNITEGKAIVLLASDKKLVNEDIKRMKELYSYKSEDTLGTLKGNARINENKVFSDIWSKTKNLLNEEDGYEAPKSKEGAWEEITKKAPESTKNIEGKTPKKDAASAPKPKEGNLDKAVNQAPEAKKDMAKSVKKVSVKPKEGPWEEVTGGEKMIETEASAPKEGPWEEIKTKSTEATKHIHLKENDMDDEDLVKEVEDDLNNLSDNEPESDDTIEDTDSINDTDTGEVEDTDTDDVEDTDDSWNKDTDTSSSDEKEPSKSEIGKEEIPTDTDDDDEEEITIPVNKGQLLYSQSSNKWWIKGDGINSEVPADLIDIASDKSKKAALRASLIIQAMKDREMEPEMETND